jgi:hypothetical protein
LSLLKAPVFSFLFDWNNESFREPYSAGLIQYLITFGSTFYVTPPNIVTSSKIFARAPIGGGAEGYKPEPCEQNSSTEKRNSCR